MAATDAAFATGKDDGEVRRRNVQGYQKANGGTVLKIEEEDTKKLPEVSLIRPSSGPECFGDTNCSAAVRVRSRCLPRRMGVLDRTLDFYCSCILYTDMADWSVSYRHLG
jgi:hypothetical protein